MCQRVFTADMSCDKAMLAGPSSRMPWNAQSESAIIRNGTSFWLWVNRYMEKLAKHVLLISLHWAHEQSLFLSWWSGTPLYMGKAAVNLLYMHCLLWEIGESADTVQWFLRIITYRWHLAGKGRQGPRLSIRIDIWILPSLYLVMT